VAPVNINIRRILLSFHVDFSEQNFPITMPSEESSKKISLILAAVGSFLWLIWGLTLRHLIYIHFDIAFTDWTSFIFWTIFIVIYTLFCIWMLSDLLFDIFHDVVVALFVFVTYLGLSLFYIMLAISQLLLYLMSLLTLAILVPIQYAFFLGQLLLFSVLGLCLLFFLFSYFWGLQFLSISKRLYRASISAFLSFAWKICVVRRPRYQHSVSRSQCIDGCTQSLENTLCKECSDLVKRSPLLIGTAWGFTRPVKYHHRSRSCLEKSASKCHLCSTLSRSIAKWPSQYGTTHSDKLTIKLWETRPIFGKPLLRIQVHDNPDSEPLTVEEFNHGMSKPEDRPYEHANMKKGLRVIYAILQRQLTPRSS